MRRVKANMPSSQPIGAMPFMEADPITGYPITKVEKGKYFCTEAVLKRNAFPKQESEKVFDNMVTEKEIIQRWRYAILMEIVWETVSDISCRK